jgi:(E)-4-hydroxy-3-methylbut-2-enyl-diphosphate synthase
MFCKSLTNYQRFDVKPVVIGDIPMGSSFPVRIQTMTNTNTQNVDDTTAQIIRSIEKGADFVRITTPTLKDVEALKKTQKKLAKLGFDKPLIADIHFNPKVAEAACEVAQKVRINPGNFVDSKKFKELGYSKKLYDEELQKISDISTPLFEQCKKHNTSIRIGTNHGSLSDRIISKYGNTAIGLVEATFEFLEICKKNNFDKIVVSIKSSNPTVMVQANRLLVDEMKKRKLEFPIHLGVTEAGNKKDGRIKSAVGIGALLVDGIGDTIRVSLTEKPENEIPVAIQITEHAQKRNFQEKLQEIKPDFFSPYSFERRKTYQINNIGGSKPLVVIADCINNKIIFDEFEPDYIISKKEFRNENIQSLVKFSDWKLDCEQIPIMTCEEYLNYDKSILFAFIEISFNDLNDRLLKRVSAEKNIVFVAKNVGDNVIGEFRLIFSILSNHKCETPVIIRLDYNETDEEKFAIQSSIDSSIFLIDGLADGILLTNLANKNLANIVDTSFDILQASHRRLSKTEYISCPSCGRTLFDLEDVTDKVQIRTKHLKGLKIAIMGCIVNGPGEVADADYGYIGSGNNKVTLFKGKIPVKKNIDEDLAVEELINLIKENGDWIEPQ